MKWISVEEQLPKRDQEVLAWNGSKMFVASRWWFDEKPENKYFKATICTCCDQEYDKKITHWMPLPEPPKDDQ